MDLRQHQPGSVDGGGGTTPQTFTATPALAIPDNLYRGSFGGPTMACSTIDTSALLAGSTASTITLNVAQSHTWVGDLVIKLQTPSGTIQGVMSRPGAVEALDDGISAGGAGNNANMAIAAPVRTRTQRRPAQRPWAADSDG